MAVISVDTTDDHKYDGVRIYYYDSENLREEISFNTDDFVKDWYQATRFYLTTIQRLDKNESNLVLSITGSVREYIDKNPKKYSSVFLMVEDTGPELKYITKENSFKERMLYRTGWEIFLPYKDVWTWEYYKDYCTK